MKIIKVAILTAIICCTYYSGASGQHYKSFNRYYGQWILTGSFMHASEGPGAAIEAEKYIGPLYLQYDSDLVIISKKIHSKTGKFQFIRLILMPPITIR